MIVGENVPRALTAAGILAVLAAGAWVAPLLPADAQAPSKQEAPKRERLREAENRDLRDTLVKLEQMRADLEAQRQALEAQRRALEAKFEALQRALQREPAQKKPAGERRPGREVEIEIAVKNALQQVEKIAAKKGQTLKVIIVNGDQPKPMLAPQANLGPRLDHVERMLLQALQELRSLRQEMGGPGGPMPMPRFAPPGGPAAPPAAKGPTAFTPPANPTPPGGFLLPSGPAPGFPQQPAAGAFPATPANPVPPPQPPAAGR
jgi:hypothetical protein